MHIPDNYLSPATCAVFGAAMIPIWKTAVTKVKKEISKKKMPMLGLCAAFSFLIMMFNLPLPGGTTGHAVGATLIAILLGPYAAIIAMTIALAVQALFFGDGGVLAFGVNAFNMAFVMPVTGYFIYSLLKGNNTRGKRPLAAAFAGAYTGVVTGAFFAGLEFGLQPLLFKDGSGMPLYSPYPLSVSIPAMVIPHALVIGIIEGFLTVGIYSYIGRLSPENLYERGLAGKNTLLTTLSLLIILSPLGLLAGGAAFGEWSTTQLKNMVGYVPKLMSKGIAFNAPMKAYGIKGISPGFGYFSSALAGTVVIILIFRFIYLLRNKDPK